MVKIQIISDIHLEFYSKVAYENILTPNAPMLFLCGDIHPAGSEKDFEKLKDFLGWCSMRYEQVFYVMGNHEFYTSEHARRANTMDVIIQRMRSGFKCFKNVHFLCNNATRITINKKPYCIIGTTLWTNLLKADQKYIQESMNDYANIYVKDAALKSGARRLRITDVMQFHKQAETFLKRSIGIATKENIPTIIISHHKPVISKTPTGPLQMAYEVDMTHLMNSPIILWIYGHTHKHHDQKIKGVRIYSNAYGYPGQQNQAGYVRGATILI